MKLPEQELIRSATLLSFIVTLSVFANSAERDDGINYASTPPNDAVSKLVERLKKNEAKLERDPIHGYLPSLLKELNVLVSSQMLVFSKTSFQRQKISPETPRALYFNDDVYIGTVKGGDIELAVIDAKQGTQFYTLAQREITPQITRHTDNCLQCHESSMTEGIPGLLVRSVFPDSDGMPIYSAGTFRISHESPLKERWGGWYVTGTHGDQRHMGNVIARGRDALDYFNAEAGANITKLDKLFNTADYLTADSDIVALMVLEHQVKMHNLIIKAIYAARLALRDERIMNKALERGENFQSDSTLARIKGATEPLLKYMLFTEEAALTAPVKGTTTFVDEFVKQGPRDSKGRSLRDFDLQKRMFKYPCSYLIYSDALDAFPERAREQVYRRFWEILTGEDKSADYAKLSRDDRTAIREILSETKKNLPEFWK